MINVELTAQPTFDLLSSAMNAYTSLIDICPVELWSVCA